MMDQETEKQIVEVAGRVEALEQMVAKLADNILDLDKVLNQIAEYIVPETEEEKK
tara:strand:- start:1146 stop:1310 length:165 start_codon:yes stop_codon:yes gene_type:complete